MSKKVQEKEASERKLVFDAPTICRPNGDEDSDGYNVVAETDTTGWICATVAFTGPGPVWAKVYSSSGMIADDPDGTQGLTSGNGLYYWPYLTGVHYDGGLNWIAVWAQVDQNGTISKVTGQFYGVYATEADCNCIMAPPPSPAVRFRRAPSSSAPAQWNLTVSGFGPPLEACNGSYQLKAITTGVWEDATGDPVVRLATDSTTYQLSFILHGQTVAVFFRAASEWFESGPTNQLLLDSGTLQPSDAKAPKHLTVIAAS
jgi:hypothetical protein